MAARLEGRRLVAAMRAMEGAGGHGGEAALDGMEGLPPLTDEGEGALLDDHALADALVDDHGVAVQLDRPEREHEAGANLALEPARVRSEEAAFKVEGAMGGLKLLSVDGKREGGPTPVALTTYTFSDEGARVKLRVDVKDWFDEAGDDGRAHAALEADFGDHSFDITLRDTVNAARPRRLRIARTHDDLDVSQCTAKLSRSGTTVFVTLAKADAARVWPRLA